mmetsp:Transcript_4271/g.12047  ORF Transcript_4271/g.12047 Transcript_4271/m.12047 type:complete len:265 (-) Transcript_4271:950-1744(-)
MHLHYGLPGQNLAGDSVEWGGGFRMGADKCSENVESVKVYGTGGQCCTTHSIKMPASGAPVCASHSHLQRSSRQQRMVEAAAVHCPHRTRACPALPVDWLTTIHQQALGACRMELVHQKTTQAAVCMGVPQAATSQRDPVGRRGGEGGRQQPGKEGSLSARGVDKGPVGLEEVGDARLRGADQHPVAQVEDVPLAASLGKAVLDGGRDGVGAGEKHCWVHIALHRQLRAKTGTGVCHVNGPVQADCVNAGGGHSLEEAPAAVGV